MLRFENEPPINPLLETILPGSKVWIFLSPGDSAEDYADYIRSGIQVSANFHGRIHAYVGNSYLESVSQMRISRDNILLLITDDRNVSVVIQWIKYFDAVIGHYKGHYTWYKSPKSAEQLEKINRLIQSPLDWLTRR